MWEDPNCENGGRWIIRAPKSHSNWFWENLMLSFIGEQFTLQDEILGIVIALKPHNDTIFIWNRNGNDEKVKEQIREDIVKICQID